MRSHTLQLLAFFACASLVKGQNSSTPAAEKIPEDHPRKKQLDRILGGDRNTSKLVLPLENTVIVDATEGRKINGLGNGTSLDLQKATQAPQNSSQKDGKLLALIAVMSQHIPEERLRRDAIRNSWARWAPELNMKVVFFLGIKSSDLTSQVVSSLIEEFNTFGDIVIDNMEEDYYRLPVKVLRSFKWFLQRYSNETLRPTFFVKTDTDVFIKLRHLADVLNKVANQTSFIGGKVSRNGIVYRDPNPNNKFYMPLSYWPENKYSDYTIGLGYILSSALLPALLKSSCQEKLIQFEDLYITGIIASSKLKLKLTDVPGLVYVDSRATETEKKNNFMFHFYYSVTSTFADLYREFQSN